MAINFSDLTKKLDIQGLVKNVKSMVSPTGQTPKPVDANDAIGLKMAELSLLLQELSKNYATQAKQLEQANTLLNEVDALIKATLPPKSPETPTAESPAEKS